MSENISNKVFVDVILPIKVANNYTYAVPVDLIPFVKIGQRVLVQFGQKKYYSAIICRIHTDKPSFDYIKGIETIIDEDSIVLNTQLQFWQWVSKYYMCTQGEVMDAALPAGLKLSSETIIVYNEYYEGEFDFLEEQELIIVQALKNKKGLTFKDIQDLLEKKQVTKHVKFLLEKGIAIASENLDKGFIPKKQSCIRLQPDLLRDEIKLEEIFNSLQNAPKQLEIIMYLMQLGKSVKHIPKSNLIKDLKINSSSLKGLIDKKVVEEFSIEISRLGLISNSEISDYTLSDVQNQKWVELENQLSRFRTVLFHGITGSGKTLLYFKLIQKAFERGEQSLYLLPEIALTAQLVNRLKAVFGDSVGIYHSRFGNNERVEVWNKVLNSEYKIIIGARSSLFLPFQNLKCIIIDEEHDHSFKQQDPAPRYNAKDAAIYLAGVFDAKVVLGSATPSIETWYKAKSCKFGFVSLDQRFGNSSLPDIEIIDISDAVKRKQMQGVLSEKLATSIEKILKEKKQVILFHNRRGYSFYRHCKTCGNYYKCKNCEVSLTYHKGINKLVCHYCGYKENIENKCKFCGTVDLETRGLGTERLEDELSVLFPNARIGRMDLDTTRSKEGHARLISEFENRELDILVGTQMVSKGLDFEHVELVGVVQADQLLVFPGYKSVERAFQLLTQVSGRSGRQSNTGKVIIQTSNAQHELYNWVKENNFESFVNAEEEYRKRFMYPPFSRMIEITLKHKDDKLVRESANHLASDIKKLNTGIILGPTTPMIFRIKDKFLQTILIKADGSVGNLEDFKNKIAHLIDKLKSDEQLKQTEIVIDVDPIN